MATNEPSSHLQDSFTSVMFGLGVRFRCAHYRGYLFVDAFDGAADVVDYWARVLKYSVLYFWRPRDGRYGCMPYSSPTRLRRESSVERSSILGSVHWTQFIAVQFYAPSRVTTDFLFQYSILSLHRSAFRVTEEGLATYTGNLQADRPTQRSGKYRKIRIWSHTPCERSVAFLNEQTVNKAER